MFCVQGNSSTARHFWVMRTSAVARKILNRKDFCNFLQITELRPAAKYV